MIQELRELEHQLSLSHQHAASLLKQSKPGQWERNQATIQQLQKQIEIQRTLMQSTGSRIDFNKNSTVSK